MGTPPLPSRRPRPDHYFSEAPEVASRPSEIDVSVRGQDLTLATDRGTFSPGRLDPGTRLLLERAPAPPEHGRFLDLGCGYGVIAVAMARLAPAAHIVAVDVNARSRTLAAANAERLCLPNITVTAPDDVAPGSFDLIWSNPPIRIGKAALHELLLHWLARLDAHGSAVLVVNRHLGADSLHRWLDEHGFPTERLAAKKGYRLLRATVA